jgi:Protein of unknown function (DUF3306)
MQNSEDAQKPFLSRWSQRKLQVEQERVEQKSAGKVLPATEVAQNAADQPAAGVMTADAKALEVTRQNTKPAPLPTIDSVNLDTGVAPFFKQQADESVRRLALKKLLSDPHFNIMDGLDIYVGDYSQPDPIPASMMKNLKHARQFVMTPEEIVEAEKVDAEEALSRKLAQEEKLAQEQLAQENVQLNQLGHTAADKIIKDA